MTHAHAEQPASIPFVHRRPNLRAAIERLRAAVGRLVNPADNYLNNTYIRVPGLYLQLFDAVHLDPQSNAGQGGGGKSRPPMWTDAADQLNNIDMMVGIWPTGSAGNTIAQLKALAAKTWTVEQTNQVKRLAGIINAWADDITTLLNHDHVKYIYALDSDGNKQRVPASCPNCGVSTVQKRDSGGEVVRSPALQVITEQGATCQECSEFWPPERYVDLCKQLGFPLPAGVLE